MSMFEVNVPFLMFDVDNCSNVDFNANFWWESKDAKQI